MAVLSRRVDVLGTKEGWPMKGMLVWLLGVPVPTVIACYLFGLMG